MAQTDEVRRGSVLAGRYELGTVLGKGGMGVVFRGKHLGTDRAIAVKVLRREFAADATLAKRFVREAKAAAGLQHPNVVDILDYGVDTDGTAYQVLELLEGESLREHLERKEKLPVDVTLSLLFPVLHALAMAHARGVIHRDLKPDNIFLARNVHGRIVPKLLDFGIAKVIPKDGGAAATLSTRVGSVMGTPAYMSPEQARGTPDVGTTTDVWAIGVILFECLAGRIPFQAETASMMMARIMMEQAPSLGSAAPETAEAIALVIDRALAPKSAQRWPTMEAFASALRQAAQESGIPVPAEGASDTAPMSRPPPRNEEAEEDDQGAISSGDDIDIEVDDATRAGRSRRPRMATNAATELAGGADAPAGGAPAGGAGRLTVGTADTDRPPAPAVRTRSGHAELGVAATAPRLGTHDEARVPTTNGSRVPIVPVAVVSLVLVALALVGFWLSEQPPVPLAAPAPSIAAPVASAPEPTAAPDPIVVPAATPVVAVEAVPIEPVVAPRHDRRGHASTVQHPTASAPADTAAREAPEAERGHTGALPGVSEW